MDSEHPQPSVASLSSDRLLHGGQRLSILKLFAAACALLLAATIYLLKDGASHWLVLPVTIAMTLFGLCFWWIDRRSVAAIETSELTQKELEQGGTQAGKAALDAQKVAESCCSLDGYTCIYVLGIVLGLYFSVMPFFVHLQPQTATMLGISNPKPVIQAPPQVRPINQMPQAMTPIQRPNFAPMSVMPSSHPPAAIRPLTPPSKPQ